MAKVDVETQNQDDGLEQLIADIVGAVRGLEYGAVTVSVQGGRVVQLERNEKRRLPKTAKAASHSSV